MTQEKLNELVLQWGEDKGILSEATLATQFSKTLEEVDEIRDAIEWLEESRNSQEFKEHHLELMDAIGDTMVTLTLLAHLAGTDAVTCYEMAYNTIKDRTGSMVDGVFVKNI